jgi:hypothetical protein
MLYLLLVDPLFLKSCFHNGVCRILEPPDYATASFYVVYAGLKRGLFAYFSWSCYENSLNFVNFSSS